MSKSDRQEVVAIESPIQSEPPDCLPPTVDPIPGPARWAEVAQLEAELEADLVRDLQAELESPEPGERPAAASNHGCTRWPGHG